MGLFNSLRLSGNEQPVTVLERGMSPRQQAALEGHCRIVSLEDRVMNPCHLTAYPHRVGADGIVVLVDSDALVLTPLDDAVRWAEQGKVCMFRDPDDTRFFPEWAEIFELRAPLRRQPYYNTGFVVFSTRAFPRLLPRWWDTLHRIRDRPSFMEGASMRGDPTSQPDQDALNALLMSELPEDAVHELPEHRNVFPGDMAEVAVSDLRAMRCNRHSREVGVMQCSGGPKPWTYRSVAVQRNTHAFLRLLRRATAWDDVDLAVPGPLLPPWLRRGAVGAVAYRLVERWIRMPRLYPALRRLGHRAVRLTRGPHPR